MITEELRKYIDMVFEEERINDETDNMLSEMARVGSVRHGIPGVVIWVGTANKQHGLRVKVSKLKDKYRQDETFVIKMPSLDYDPVQVPVWIDRKTMNKILAWIKLNQKLLYDFENELITDTDDFLNQISKV